MLIDAMSNDCPVQSRDELAAYLEAGTRPDKGDWRIGVEHEVFPFRLDTRLPVSYEERGGVRDLLAGMERFGWMPVAENGIVIALRRDDGASITLEPGGQIELSGAPMETIHQIGDDILSYRRHLGEVAESNGVGLLGIGFHPTATREQTPWMPKARYTVMRAHMPAVGTMGLDMMLRTCTVQANLDYASELDMVKKMRVAVALQPLATALWANSPFTEGRPNGFKSYRAHVWTDTDNDRCGAVDFVFDDGFGFERWVDYLLDVPMYFVRRGDVYHNVAGRSFRDYLQGRLDDFKGMRPTMDDWIDHVSVAFPDVRLKQYIEMRGADGGVGELLCALPAFWGGLLYDGGSLDAAWDLVKGWTTEERARLVTQVPRHGLSTTIRGRSLRDIACEVMDIAVHGLRARRHLNDGGDDESGYLSPLLRIAESGQSPADALLEAYSSHWGQNLGPVFDDPRTRL